MSNTFALNPFSTDNSLASGEFFLGVGDVGKGPTDQTNFWASAPIGTFSYLIALDRGDGIPTFYTCSDDDELILRTNQIDKSQVRTTKEQCFSYFVGQLDKMVVNQDYQNVITDGLVLNLDAGFLPSYPATGNTWYDLNGNQFGGNNGTLTNSPGFNVIGGITLDGQNDYVNIPYAGNTSNSFTFIIVMKCNNMTSDTALNRQTLFGLSQNDNSAFRQFDIEIWGNTGVGFRGDGGSVEGTNFFGYPWTLGVDANNINVYTITLNSTGHSIYVNGTLRNTISQTRTASFDRIWLGRRSSDNYWNGTCYSFSMYNRILTAQEIKQNYFYSQFDLFRRQSKNDGGINLAGTYDCLQNRFMNLNSAISATPSMVVVPSFGKSQNLYYSVFPNGVGTFSVNLAAAGTSKTRVNHRGVIELVGSGIARLDWLGQSCPGLLIESSSTNWIRNSLGLGGSTGSPGTAPTNWNFGPSADNGISNQITSIGQTQGINYIDFRVTGQATVSNIGIRILPDTSTSTSATQNQVWTNSAWIGITVHSGTTPTTMLVNFQMFNSSGQFLGEVSTYGAPPLTFQRTIRTATLTNGSTAFTRATWDVYIVNGSTYDFTIRFGFPQVELGSVVTSFIPTTNAAVSRTGDTYQSPLLNFNTSSWTIFFEIEYLTNFIQQSADVSGNPLIWYFRRLSASAVNFWNQNAQQNLGSFSFSPDNSQKTFKAILSFDGTNINTYVNGTKIGNSITPTNSSPFQTLLSANTNRLIFSKSDLGLGLDGPNIIKSSCIYTKSLSDTEAISLTRL